MPRSRRTTENTQPVTHEKLVRLAKTGIGHSEAAVELGVTVGQISSLAWSKALVEAGQYSEIADSAAAIKKARDVENNRWELIAARADISVAAVKELYGGEEAAADSVISRKKKDNGDDEEETTPKRGRPAGSKTTTGKRATAAATPRRARTRAERRAGRNPS
jgi:hypothetical protein